MNLNDYQTAALVTDTFDHKATGGNVGAPGFVEKVLGLVGESGEFADKIKKLIRDNEGEVSEEMRKELVKELGDVLWYVAVIATYLDTDFDSVAEANIAKLRDRQARGVIQSSGDNR